MKHQKSIALRSVAAIAIFAAGTSPVLPQTTARTPVHKSAPVSEAHVAAPAPALQAEPVASPTELSEVVAHAATGNITASQVRDFIATLDAREQNAILRDPALMGQAVRLMIANQMALKEAEDKKWDQQPAVNEKLKQIRDRAVSEMYLQVVSAPPAAYPNDSEVEKTYEANKAAFLVPRQFKIAQIFLALPKDADDAVTQNARKKLADTLSKLKQSGADFGAIARAQSDDMDSASRGGELGWVADAQIRPEIKSQIEGLQVDAIGDPLKLDDGWHIIKLLETKASVTRPLSEVRAVLVQRMRTQMAEANRRAYLGKILEQSPPAINEIALSKAFSLAGRSASK